MTAIAFSPYHMLTDAQKLRVPEIWRDGVEPTEYVYELHDDQVVGRAALLKKAKGKVAQFSEFDYGLPPSLPAPVSSALRDPDPITTRDVLHELPPAMARPQITTRRRPARRATLREIERSLEFPYPGAHGRKRTRGLGAVLIHWIAVAIYNKQKGSHA